MVPSRAWRIVARMPGPARPTSGTFQGLSIAIYRLLHDSAQWSAARAFFDSISLLAVASHQAVQGRPSSPAFSTFRIRLPALFPGPRGPMKTPVSAVSACPKIVVHRTDHPLWSGFDSGEGARR
jgi:hypothetical protein